MRKSIFLASLAIMSSTALGMYAPIKQRSEVFFSENNYFYNRLKSSVGENRNRLMLAMSGKNSDLLKEMTSDTLTQYERICKLIEYNRSCFLTSKTTDSSIRKSSEDIEKCKNINCGSAFMGGVSVGAANSVHKRIHLLRELDNRFSSKIKRFFDKLFNPLSILRKLDF